MIAQLIINTCISAGFYVLLSAGFNLLYGTRKFVDMSFGAVASIGAYAAYAMNRYVTDSFTVGVCVAALASALAALAIDRFIYKPLRGRNASSLVQFISSLGTMIVIESIIAMIFTTQFWSVKLSDGFLSASHRVSDGAVTGVQILLIITCATTVCVLAIILKRTAFGMAIRAVSDDEEVAKIIGMQTEKVIRNTVVIAGILAGISGAFYAVDTGVYPTMSLLLIVITASSAIIGGLGSIFGAVVGGILEAGINNFSILVIPSGWQLAVMFSVLILFLLFRPNGLVNKKL